MTYLNTHDRTISPTKNDLLQPIGRNTSRTGVYMGYVKDTSDVQRNGRLRVWIPEFGSPEDFEKGWTTADYCSPFAGATNVRTNSKANIQSFEGTQTSYGFWMIPPDINNIVIIMFINGDPLKAIWVGCLYNQYMNNMVPGMAGSKNNYQYPDKKIPVAEYNKWDGSATKPDITKKPYEATKFKGLGNQGLINDFRRGVVNSSARRESPSKVFGIITPGPVINSEIENSDPASIRRKGGHSFFMDDATDNECIVLTTKTGAQIRIDETNGYVYLINRDGTAWIEMDQKGNIDIFGATNISMRAQKDLNIRADRNVNIEAGQNVFIKAAKDTVNSTTTFTYDVNNIPKQSTIPLYKYVGEGKGIGGNIVFQSLNNLYSTSKNTTYITVTENNMNIKVGNTLNVTTALGGQNFNSKQGIKLTTDSAFDFSSNGNIRMGSKGQVSIVGQSNLILCTDAKMSLNSSTDLVLAAANRIGFTTSQIWTTATGVHDDLNTLAAEGALSAGSASAAEIKPLNEKINILATWKDPTSKFIRNSEAFQTTVSRLPTYEPCPEHEMFNNKSIVGYVPSSTGGAVTYIGSGGAGNSVQSSPDANTSPGANNTSIKGDPASDSVITKDINMNAFEEQLKLHEGVKYVSYIDSVGKPTGGIGHLLRTNEISLYPVPTPISESQVSSWFQEDSTYALIGAQRLIGVDVWSDLSDIRKRACGDLCFNLGENGLSKFKSFLSAIKAKEFDKAGDELRASKWYTQVGRRGPNIVTMIVRNVDPLGLDKKYPG